MEGRKREERVGELRNVAGQKRGITNWRGGRGRSGLVSFETWYVINEDSPTGGEEREERVGELRNVARHKRGLTDWRGGRGRRGMVSMEKWQGTKQESPEGGETEGRDRGCARERYLTRMN